MFVLAAGVASAAPVGLPELSLVDSLVSAGRTAEAETLATRTIARLESSPRADSAALAGFRARYARLRFSRPRARGEKGIAAAQLAADWFGRRSDGALESLQLRALAGRMLYEIEQDDSSATVLERALQEASARSDAPADLLADLHEWLGRSLLQSRGFRPGAPHLWRAYAIRAREHGAEDPATIELLAEIGSVYSTAAQYDSARILLGRARTVLERDAKGNAQRLGRVLGMISVLERQQGHLAESVDAVQRAIDVTREAQGDSSLDVARLRATLALRLHLLEDHVGAARMLDLALPVLAARLGPEAAYTLNNRIMRSTLRAGLGDTTAALAELRSMRAVMERQSERHRRNLSYCVAMIANLEHALGASDSAQVHFAEALALLGPANDVRGTGRADVLSMSFDTQRGAARAAATDTLGTRMEAIASATALRRSSLWPGLLAARARAEARVGRLAAAWTHAIEAESLSRSELSANARALAESRALELANRVSAPLDAIVSVALDSGGVTIPLAWDRLVRWRGLVREEVARLRSPRGEPGLRESHERWARSQREYARLVVSGAGEARDGGAATALEDARREAEEAERQFRRDAGRAAPASPGDIGLADVLRSLAPGEALVSFHLVRLGALDERLAAFVARAGESPRLFDLGPAARVAELVNAWTSQLASSPRQRSGGLARAESACCQAGLRVRAAVWDPIQSALEDVHGVDVVGDDPVRDLPWYALPEDRGYLVDSPITIRTLDAERDRLRSRGAPGTGGLLAVGDPDFGSRRGDPGGEASSTTVRSAVPECVFTSGLTLEPLPSARAEAEDVASAWREHEPTAARLRIGAEATEAGFKAEAGDASVIHLATHGIVVQDTCRSSAPGTRGVGGVAPLTRPAPRRRPTAAPAPPAATREPLPWAGRRVWLAFAGAGRPPREAADENEGWLTAEEVATLNLSGVDWVVLSACQSGLTESWARDGVTGMRRAFALAGAGAVIASQWSVEDSSTREWMRALHAARAAGARGASDALRAACRSVLAERRASKRSTHPFYWAAFSATGD